MILVSVDLASSWTSQPGTSQSKQVSYEECYTSAHMGLISQLLRTLSVNTDSESLRYIFCTYETSPVFELYQLQRKWVGISQYACHWSFIDRACRGVNNTAKTTDPVFTKWSRLGVGNASRVLWIITAARAGPINTTATFQSAIVTHLNKVTGHVRVEVGHRP